MTSRGTVITFTSLFPSAAFPTHGLFVRERLRRVVAAARLDWVVVSPVPLAPRGLRRGDYRRYAAMPDREEVDGVEVWHPRYRHLPGLSTSRQARRVARGAMDCVRQITEQRGRPALLDAHYVYPDGIAALMVGDELELPVVVTARGSDLNVVAGAATVRRQVRDLTPRALARIAVSEPLRRRFVELAEVDDTAVALVRNGVDLDRFQPGDRREARRALGLDEDGSWVLGVGRLVRGKGFRLMVEALHSHPDMRLVLVGDGPERERLARAAPEGRVVFLGAQPPDRVAVAYRAADVMVLPSVREGWPNVVTEALASGTPVVATDVGSVPEMLADPVAGAVVPLGDAAALGRAVAQVLETAPEPGAVRAVATRFSWEEPVRELSTLFLEGMR